MEFIGIVAVQINEKWFLLLAPVTVPPPPKPPDRYYVDSCIVQPYPSKVWEGIIPNSSLLAFGVLQLHMMRANFGFTDLCWNGNIRAVVRNQAYEVFDKMISMMSCYLELCLKPKLLIWRFVTDENAFDARLAQLKETLVAATCLYILDCTTQEYFFKCYLPLIAFSLLHMVQDNFSPLEWWLNVRIGTSVKTDAYEIYDRMLSLISYYLELFHCYWFGTIIVIVWMLHVSWFWFIKSEAIGYKLDSKECIHVGAYAKSSSVTLMTLGSHLIGLPLPNAFLHQLRFLNSNSKLIARKKDIELPYVLINDSICKPIENIVIGILISAKFVRMFDALRLPLLLKIAFSTITYDAICYYWLLVCNLVKLPLKIFTKPKVDKPVNCDDVSFIHQDMMKFTSLQLDDAAAEHNISWLQFKSVSTHEIAKQTLVLVDPIVVSVGNNLDVHRFNITFGSCATCLKNYDNKSFTKIAHGNSDTFVSAMQKTFYCLERHASFGCHYFHSHDLEDKVIFNGGGNVTYTISEEGQNGQNSSRDSPAKED